VDKRIRSPPSRLTSMVSGSAIEYLMGGMLKRIVTIIMEESVRETVARRGTPRALITNVNMR